MSSGAATLLVGVAELWRLRRLGTCDCNLTLLLGAVTKAASSSTLGRLLVIPGNQRLWGFDGWWHLETKEGTAVPALQVRQRARPQDCSGGNTHTDQMLGSARDD